MVTVGYSHGTNPNIRKTDVHIEIEPPWLNAVNFELNMMKLIEPALDGFKVNFFWRENIFYYFCFKCIFLYSKFIKRFI